MPAMNTTRLFFGARFASRVHEGAQEESHTHCDAKRSVGVQANGTVGGFSAGNCVTFEAFATRSNALDGGDKLLLGFFPEVGGVDLYQLFNILRQDGKVLDKLFDRNLFA